MADFIDGDLRVTGNLTVQGNLLPKRPRTDLEQENIAEYPVNLVTLRVWDALQTALPGTAASDDLGITGGTWGTDAVSITAGDLKAAGATTRRARFTVRLPVEYVAGETVLIQANAGMKTTAADVSCTIDFEAYLTGENSLISGSDLVTTSATTINSTSFAAKQFTLTSSNLSPGDEIDVRVSIACNDAATVASVIPMIAKLSILADIRG